MRYNIHLIGFILTMTIFITTLGASCQMQGSTGKNSTPDITTKRHTINSLTLPLRWLTRSCIRKMMAGRRDRVKISPAKHLHFGKSI
jgi:hypothetical protein